MCVKAGRGDNGQEKVQVSWKCEQVEGQKENKEQLFQPSSTWDSHKEECSYQSPIPFSSLIKGWTPLSELPKEIQAFAKLTGNLALERTFKSFDGEPPSGDGL